MKTADLVDEFGDEVIFCNRPFLMLGRKRQFSGPIVTVKCFEDNSLLKSTLQQPGEGCVLVVDAGSSTRRAVLGDQIALLLRDNGWAGAVINGAVRDRDEIEGLDVAVFCLGTSPVKSTKTGAGAAGVEVAFGDVCFRPGAWVYADRDGVLVAERKLA